MNAKKLIANVQEGKFKASSFNKLRAAKRARNMKAGVYNDDTNAQVLENVFINPQRGISALAQKVLQEVKSNGINNNDPYHVILQKDGQVASYERVSAHAMRDVYGIDLREVGTCIKTFDKISSQMLVEYASAGNADFVESTQYLIQQAIIACENQMIIDMLDKAAAASNNVIKTTNFDKQNFIDAQLRLQQRGWDAVTCICSPEVKSAMNLWTNVPWTTQAIIEANNGTVAFDPESAKHISWLNYVRVLNMDWWVIPSKDKYRVIQPNTAYVLVAPERLGQFVRVFDEENAIKNSAGINYFATERFAAAVLNNFGVIKIVKG